MSFLKKTIPIFGTVAGTAVSSAVTLSLATLPRSKPVLAMQEIVSLPKPAEIASIKPIAPKEDKKQDDSADGNAASEIASPDSEKNRTKEIEEEPEESSDEESSESSPPLEISELLPSESKVKEGRVSSTKRKLNEGLESVVTSVRDAASGLWGFLAG